MQGKLTNSKLGESLDATRTQLKKCSKKSIVLSLTSSHISTSPRRLHYSVDIIGYVINKLNFNLKFEMRNKKKNYNTIK